MAGKAGPETKLIKKMMKAAYAKYGSTRLVIVKYHGGPYTKTGVSDLLVCLDGVYGACEVKAPESYGRSIWRALTKGPSTPQRSFVAKVQRAGGIGWFAASVEQFMDGLEAMDWLSANDLRSRSRMDPLITGVIMGLNNNPICTCILGACEYDTETGCLYCRRAPLEEPCPVEMEAAVVSGNPDEDEDDYSDLDDDDEDGPMNGDTEQMDDL